MLRIASDKQRILPIMRFLKEHYEIFSLGLAVVLLLAFGLFYGLAEFGAERPAISTTPEPFVASLRTSDLNSSMAEIETRNPHGLMPGDWIELSGADSESFNKSYLVSEIVFPEEYAEITVHRLDGPDMTGYFRKAQGKLALGADQGKLKLTIEVDGSAITIGGKDIDRVTGSRVARFALDDNSSADEVHGDFTLVVYQRLNRVQRIKKSEPWTAPPIGDDNVSYDLFTPPQIFLVNGKLSPKPPKPPESEKEKEPFGVQLTSFKNKPYRFNFRSWTETDAQLFDERIKRSTIVQIGKCYKRGLRETGYKMEETTEEDTEKTIKVTGFNVRFVKNPKTGGTRPVATLTLFDFPLRRAITIINRVPSMAGQLVIEVASTLPDTINETQSLTETTTEFFLGGKEYRVLKIDPSNHSLLLEKLTDNPEKNERELLRLPVSSPPSQEP